jgi:hypothetical protein
MSDTLIDYNERASIQHHASHGTAVADLAFGNHAADDAAALPLLGCKSRHALLPIPLAL